MCSINHDLKAIYLHIPKNGGLYVQNILEKYYNFKTIYFTRSDHYLFDIDENKDENIKNYKNISQDNTLTITKENKKQLLNLGLISVNGNKLHVAEKSPYACWHCTYNFDTYPLFLPEKFQNNKLDSILNV